MKNPTALVKKNTLLSRALYLFYFSLLPLVAVIVYLGDTFLESAINALITIFVNLFFLWLFQLNLLAKTIAFILKFIETIFALLVIITRGPFDIFYAFRNWDVIPDIILSHTSAEIVFFAGSVLAMSFIYYVIFKKISLHLTYKTAIVFVIALVLIQTTAGRYVFFDRLTIVVANAPNSSALRYPKISKERKILFDRNDTIVLLHLEDWNSRVVNGDVLIGNELYDEPMAPVFLQYATRGLYFPEHYSNSMLTILSEENTLCGIGDNLGTRYAKRNEDFSFQCLPEIFSGNQFKTYFFKAHNLNYHNTGSFMKKIGFDTVVNREIMQEDDTEYYWGYRDDIFYQRIFEFLASEPPSKKFIYIAVSGSHHSPFEMQEERNKTNRVRERAVCSF